MRIGKMKHITPHEFATQISQFVTQKPICHYTEKSLKEVIYQEVSEGALGNSIYLLMQLEDYYQGIFWTIQKQENDHDILFRDARGQQKIEHTDNKDHVNTQIQQMSLAANALNHARAALKLAETEDKALSQEQIKKLNQFIKHYLEHFFEAHPNNRLVETKKFIFILTEFFARQIKIHPDNLIKRIGKAKDYMNFEDKPYHVATVSTLKDENNKTIETVFKCDIALCGINKSLEELYKFDDTAPPLGLDYCLSGKKIF